MTKPRPMTVETALIVAAYFTDEPPLDKENAAVLKEALGVLRPRALKAAKEHSR